MTWAELTPIERRLLRDIAKNPSGEARYFNSRRLVDHGLVERTNPSLYKITFSGQMMLAANAHLSEYQPFGQWKE
jgi:hypothetical protein